MITVNSMSPRWTKKFTGCVRKYYDYALRTASVGREHFQQTTRVQAERIGPPDVALASSGHLSQMTLAASRPACSDWSRTLRAHHNTAAAPRDIRSAGQSRYKCEAPNARSICPLYG